MESSRDIRVAEVRAAVARFLHLEDEPQPVDLSFVLGSATPSNIDPAIDLFKAGLTKRIWISGKGPKPRRWRPFRKNKAEPESRIYQRLAIERGVPAEAIWVEDRSSNTLENFVFSARMIEATFGWTNIHTVSLTAKPYHMRRALMTALKVWPAHLRYVMRPSYAADDPPLDEWWTSPVGRHFVMKELRSIGAYALKGDIEGF
ncbi:YdcF family protein [[Pseudomonas] carboxydohydrogena]|uniref:YdcF family protein n=1 Tax=Afipia carboxydohydrogena TaxID=290 RepID=A0ABY8BPG7_AFICR|nr:YdcF family protein [[Pseudomonas] carboxydohydrogena]WEF51879.1 YdcF family protein [[Pseudomonas] carboxydohydrogena]